MVEQGSPPPKLALSIASSIRKRYQEELARLEEENGSLRQQLSDLQLAFEERRSINRPMAPSKESWIHLLPPEILHLIFARTMPPSFLLDSSIQPGPSSSWCQAMTLKKYIVRVCKTWHAVGIEWLYDDVALRRVYQLPLLLRTLETSPETFSHLVMSITIHAYIGPIHGRSVSEQLQRVFDMCPRLFRLVFASTIPLPASLATIKPNITHLTFSEGNMYEDIISEVCDTLVSLSICACQRRPPQPYPQLQLLNLESLFVCVSPLSEEHMSCIGEIWTMPSLQRLSFTLESQRDSWRTLSGLKPFCDTHGHHLKSLQLHPTVSYSANKRYPLEMQEILDVCPTLEHLILHSAVAPNLTHPNVRWVDIWHPRPRDPPIEDLFYSITKSSFPALQGTRTLSVSLSLFPVDLPFLLPPNLILTEADSFEFRHPSVFIRHEHSHLLGGRLIDMNDLDDETDKRDADENIELINSDDDYRYSSPEEEESSEQDSESEFGETTAFDSALPPTSPGSEDSVDLWTPELSESEPEPEPESESN